MQYRAKEANDVNENFEQVSLDIVQQQRIKMNDYAVIMCWLSISSYKDDKYHKRTNRPKASTNWRSKKRNASWPKAKNYIKLAYKKNLLMTNCTIKKSNSTISKIFNYYIKNEKLSKINDFWLMNKQN